MRSRSRGPWSLLVAMCVMAHAVSAQATSFAGSCEKGPPPDLTSVEGAPDTPPRLISEGPRTPKFALKHGYRGTVQIAVIVDTAGRAEAHGATIVAASDGAMREWACDYSRRLRFTPARHGERVVRTQVVVPFTFQAFVVRRER